MLLVSWWLIPWLKLMTYFGFLLRFIGVPLAILALLTLWDWRQGRTLPADLRKLPAPWVLLTHVVLAVLWTTPWDNYLVATRVWWYNPRLVSGLTLGWVPIEEYTFFVVQTLLTGSWLLWVARRLPALAEPAPQGPAKVFISSLRAQRSNLSHGATVRLLRRPAPSNDPKSDFDIALPAPSRPRLRLAAALLFGAIWLGAVIVLLARWRPGTYLGLELGWFLPPIILQLLVGADLLWQRRRLVALAWLPAVVYLSAADSLAIGAGTWTIAPAQTTGLLLGGVLPVEEVVFFALTNTLIVFGMVLMLGTDSAVVRRLLRRL
ncbi:MAG: lycopene cyclase domain-containing protein [Chloroflexi bacterium]|nr:lycopene cyclase domain-containing protein [Chloroflexota bacterium]